MLHMNSGESVEISNNSLTVNNGITTVAPAMFFVIIVVYWSVYKISSNIFRHILYFFWPLIYPLCETADTQ